MLQGASAAVLAGVSPPASLEQAVHVAVIELPTCLKGAGELERPEKHKKKSWKG